MAGIKETSEVLVFIKALAVTYAAAAADGTVGNLRDAFLLPKILGPLKDAVQGAQMIPEEMKDLDRAELEAVTTQALQAVMALVEVVTHQAA